MIKVHYHCVYFQIHILINQTTGRLNYRADLIGVRLASINQILDPWVYILLRKSVIVKCFKIFKNFITSEFSGHSRTIKQSTKYITNYNKNNRGYSADEPEESHAGCLDNGNASVPLDNQSHSVAEQINAKTETVCLQNGISRSLSNGYRFRADESDSSGQSCSSAPARTGL